ncbi:hypothetical protein QN357_13900 [Cryobacterium sp. RTC2.1]|uniref:hypothetical protein n=1 Tax=Cryobacterium sp. RTC2.1 TaxID=3048634 RepID=UPI002B22B492|nr:hypothetical protein [Cryobacterium sp. RTC2.1]MEB0004020.1 hypothetical protein [Cryobacterium sp. RTC2.1]
MNKLETAFNASPLLWHRPTLGRIKTYWTMTGHGPEQLSENSTEDLKHLDQIVWTVSDHSILCSSKRYDAQIAMQAQAATAQRLIESWNHTRPWPSGDIDKEASRFCSSILIPLFSADSPAKIARLILLAAEATADFHFVMHNGLMTAPH